MLTLKRETVMKSNSNLKYLTSREVQGYGDRNHGKRWSEEDLEFLSGNYHKMKRGQIAYELGRTITAVHIRYNLFRWAWTFRDIFNRIDLSNDPLIKKRMEQLNG